METSQYKLWPNQKKKDPTPQLFNAYNLHPKPQSTHLRATAQSIIRNFPIKNLYPVITTNRSNKQKPITTTKKKKKKTDYTGRRTSRQRVKSVKKEATLKKRRGERSRPREPWAPTPVCSDTPSLSPSFAVAAALVFHASHRPTAWRLWTDDGVVRKFWDWPSRVRLILVRNSSPKKSDIYI